MMTARAMDPSKPERVLHVNAAVAVSGDGSAERPFKTVQEAVDAARELPGTTIELAAGQVHDVDVGTITT